MSEKTDRRWLTIGLMMCVMAISFESYAVLTAMPAAARDLGNLSLYAWTFTAFVIAMTFSIVASGQFSDRYGPIQPASGGPTNAGSIQQAENHIISLARSASL